MRGGVYYYAVNQGLVPGVYLTWQECEKNVKGFKGARFKKFSSFEAAEAFSKMPVKSSPAKNNIPPAINNKENSTKDILNNNDFIPLTATSLPVTKKRNYSTMDNSGESTIERYSTDTERVYSDIVIDADGQEIGEEIPVVIPDIYNVMNNINIQIQQFEKLKQKNKWVYINTMEWLKNCANNGWKTTAGKHITDEDTQQVMNALLQLKQIM